MAGSMSYDAISRKIYKAIINDNWDSVKQIFQDHPERLCSTISSFNVNVTPLHIAVGSNRSHHFVENLVNQIMLQENALEKLRTPTTFGLENASSTIDNFTALHEAANCGNITDARLLVKKDSEMPNIVDSDDETPLEVASQVGNEKMIRYLMSVTESSAFRGIHGASILANIINSGLYDWALYLVRVYPDLVTEVNHYGKEKTALAVLAAQENAFPSVTKLGFVKRLIYSHLALDLVKKYPDLVTGVNDNNIEQTPLCVFAAQDNAFPSVIKLEILKRLIYSQIPLNLKKTVDSKPVQDQVNVDIEDGRRSMPTDRLSFLQTCFGSLAFWNVFSYLVPCIKHILDIKLRHLQAEQLLKKMLLVLLQHENGINLPIIGSAIQIAMARGSHELVEECVRNHPQIIWYRDEKEVASNLKVRDENEGPREDEVSPSKETPCKRKGYDLFQSAIIHRQEKVFSLIMYHISAQRSRILASVDRENALHLVGKLAPYERLSAVTGVALQMQRELLWFKEVEKFTDPVQRRELNKEHKTPRMVFNEEHKNLLKDAQQWTQDTASSSTFVTSLLITITFAAMFTVPGGNNDVGKSFFARDPIFLLFVISDAIALFSSSTSVLMILSTLTHSSQEDFLYALPLRLTLGLISLFISLATTMVAFSATLVLLLRDEIWWIAGPVTLLASVPAFLFLWLQYPLLQELIGATFGRSIFHKRSNELLF